MYKARKRVSVKYGEYPKHLRRTYVVGRRFAGLDANFTRTSTTPTTGRKQYLSV